MKLLTKKELNKKEVKNEIICFYCAYNNIFDCSDNYIYRRKETKEMSRAIKFRIWKKSIKKYIDLTTFTLTNDGEITAIVDSDILEPALNKDDYILEQSTGLKDKNGKEIYEGDIVDYCGECTRVIQYEDEGARFIHRDILFEVIGNIHENPELLGGIQ